MKIELDNYITDTLFIEISSLIRKNVPSNQYYKEDLINELRTYGYDEWGDLVEDGEWKLIDMIEQSIANVVINWCNSYEKDFDKETILQLSLNDISKNARHSYFNIVPDDFPECEDRQADRFLSFIKMNVSEFIKLDFKEICELPLYAQNLKEEKKEERFLKVLEYQHNIIDYINNLED
jgi:hypothetical protein